MRPVQILFTTALLLAGQESLKFEVASIRPNAENDNRVMMRMQQGGRWHASGVTLKMLVAQAYDVREFQVSGGPKWMDSDRWDIVAKAEGVADRVPPEQLRSMLQALLTERFQLKIRQDSKEMPVYALVVGKGGHKLKAVEEDMPMIRMGRGQLEAKGARMDLLARQLAGHIGRPVVDKTGLTGSYEISLKWSPAPGEGPAMMARMPPPPDAVPAADDSGPTIYTALQEQLGLKLEPQRGPVPHIVIENATKPTQD